MKQLLKNKGYKRIIIILHLIALVTLVLDYGFPTPSWVSYIILAFYTFILFNGVFFTIVRQLYDKKKSELKVRVFDVLSIAFILYCLVQQYYTHSSFNIVSEWLRWAIILKLAREFGTSKINYKRSVLNPAQLFIFSFLILIFGGALLLMLPTVAYQELSFIDALFTATSAVCVTGLIVVDTSTVFTPFGHSLIMILIQAGGLGILTFASYFSFFFKGGATYENQIALGDMTNSNKLGEVFGSLKRILIITFFIEFIGAVFIYINLDPSLIPKVWDRVFFAAFHSISAFCNAGFSTLSGNMMQEGYVFNYPLQFTIVMIFVFGGLGFPIVINVLRYLKHFIRRYFLFFVAGRGFFKPRILTLTSKINLITTLSLTLVGSIIIFAKEYHNTLNIHHGIGKIVTAIFTATTPRTAGFNSIDFNQMHLSSIIIIILLMWIGASPASTGGGIKTSTFAIAILNFLSLAKGKTKIEIWRREIADISVRRAFATMALSLIVIGIGIFFIAHFDAHLRLLDIAFECFSAYSTVGLSLGITGDLSNESKIVLIIIMFIGRVTMLSILIAVFKKAKSLQYSYPTDEILIN